MQKIIDGLQDYCQETGTEALLDLVGQVRIDPHLSDRWLRFAQQSG